MGATAPRAPLEVASAKPLSAFGTFTYGSQWAGPGMVGGLDVDATALHAVLPEDQVDASGTHVHALHGIPAEQPAVERKRRFVIGSRELVPGEVAECGRTCSLRGVHSPDR